MLPAQNTLITSLITACDALISSQSIWAGHDFLVKLESRLASTFGAVEGSSCLRRPGHPEWMVSTSVRRPYSQSPKPAARVQARIQRSTGASGLGVQDCCETLVTLIGHSLPGGRVLTSVSCRFASDQPREGVGRPGSKPRHPELDVLLRHTWRGKAEMHTQTQASIQQPTRCVLSDQSLEQS